MNDLHFALSLAANSLLTIVMFSVFAILVVLIFALLFIFSERS
jgi:hypothetical protein